MRALLIGCLIYWDLNWILDGKTKCIGARLNSDLPPGFIEINTIVKKQPLRKKLVRTITLLLLDLACYVFQNWFRWVVREIWGSDILLDKFVLFTQTSKTNTNTCQPLRHPLRAMIKIMNNDRESRFYLRNNI